MNNNNQLIGLKDVNKIVHPDYFQPRQWDVFLLKLLGCTGKQMAEKLGLSEHTIYDRMHEVRQIIGIGIDIGNSGTIHQNQRRLMQWAIDNNLIDIKFEVPNV